MGNRSSSQIHPKYSPTATTTTTTHNLSVFLGGMCGKTTWRQPLMAILDHNDVSYYNPQVDNWHEGLVELEQEAKDECTTLVFVIGRDTRGAASCIEAAYYIGTGRKTVLVIQPYPETPETLEEARDLNRGRTYLRSLATLHNTPVFDDTTDEKFINACIA